MDIIKRNIGFLVFLVISLIIIVVLAVAERNQARLLKEKRQTFSDHVDFFKGLDDQKEAVDEENLEIVRDNLETARSQLRRLQKELAGRSQLNISEMASDETKVYLDRKVREMEALLEDNNVEFAEVARDFSFGPVIQSTGLPEQSVEVPALLRQMAVVERIVELIADSGIMEVTELSRPAGIREIRQDDYTVNRFELRITGSLESVKKLVNSIHEDQRFYFIIPHLQWDSEQTERTNLTRTAGTTNRGRELPSRMNVSDDLEASDQNGERPTKEERRIPIQDTITATIPIHFVEFKPVQED